MEKQSVPWPTRVSRVSGYWSAHLLMKTGEEVSDPILVVDSLGAGMHQRVLITTDGVGIRARVGNEHSPIRYWTNAVLE